MLKQNQLNKSMIGKDRREFERPLYNFNSFIDLYSNINFEFFKCGYTKKIQ